MVMAKVAAQEHIIIVAIIVITVPIVTVIAVISQLLRVLNSLEFILHIAQVPLKNNALKDSILIDEDFVAAVCCKEKNSFGC